MSHEIAELVEMAKEVRNNAYAPYSNYLVGCVIEAENGELFTGCNFENTCVNLGVCSERVAVGKAVSEGVTKFKRVVLVTQSEHVASPCGACRQVLAEFSPNMEVVMTNLKGDMKTMTIAELFPESFAMEKE